MKSLLAILGVLVAVGAAVLPARADDYGYKRTLDFSTPVAGASALGVSGYNGNIHLYADTGNTVRVHAVLGARSAAALQSLNVTVSHQGSTLRIADVCPGTRNFIIWSFKDCDIELDVHYPRGLPVSVHSENGNIVIDGTQGAVSIANGNGNITVSGAGGPVSVNNGNGNIEISGAPANVSTSNHNGNVDVTLARNWRGDAIALHTHAGNVHLDVPHGFAATYSARVTLGNVENRADIQKGPVTVTATTTFGNVVISQQ